MRVYLKSMSPQGREPVEVEMDPLDQLVVEDDLGNELLVSGDHRWGLTIRTLDGRLVPVQESCNTIAVASLPLDWRVGP